MSVRLFESADGRIWTVTKTGSSLRVNGKRREGEKLIYIAQSCARKLGVEQTKSGVPFRFINEHRRIWATLWDMGREADSLPGETNSVLTKC